MIAGKDGKEEHIDLRDWFAGMAMQGLVVCTKPTEAEGEFESWNSWVSTWAYMFADSMLKERSKGND